MRWHAPLAWLGVATLLAASAPGCVRTPESLCFEWEAAIQAMFDRCGIAADFEPVWPDGMRTGCEGVARVTRPEEISNQCIPWTRREDVCEMLLDARGEITLPAFCDASHFQVYD